LLIARWNAVLVPNAPAPTIRILEWNFSFRAMFAGSLVWISRLVWTYVGLDRTFVFVAAISHYRFDLVGIEQLCMVNVLGIAVE
jgi:hypothetical protein